VDIGGTVQTNNNHDDEMYARYDTTTIMILGDTEFYFNRRRSHPSTSANNFR
jgi:hypothetical protein